MQVAEPVTDEGMRQDILQQIASNPEVLSTDVNVSVEGGIVTLTGFVHSYFEKLAAENVAKKASGVVGVANDIAVTPGASDPEIAREAVRALRAGADRAARNIAVTVKNRFVTLEGTVHEISEKRSAERAVTNLHGIKGIANRLEIE